jgi:hypothetical protein
VGFYDVYCVPEYREMTEPLTHDTQQDAENKDYAISMLSLCL